MGDHLEDHQKPAQRHFRKDAEEGPASLDNYPALYGEPFPALFNGLLSGDRFRLEQVPVALVQDSYGKDEVLCKILVYGLVKLFSEGEYASVRNKACAKPALKELKDSVILPVKTFSPAYGVLGRHRVARPAADEPNSAVGEVAHQLSDRVLSIAAVCVRKDHYPPLGVRHGKVLRPGLSGFLVGKELHPPAGVAPHYLVCPVGRAVGDDDYLQLVPWIIELKGVFKPRRDGLLLVVRKDE